MSDTHSNLNPNRVHKRKHPLAEDLGYQGSVHIPPNIVADEQRAGLPSSEGPLQTQTMEAEAIVSQQAKNERIEYNEQKVDLPSAEGPAKTLDVSQGARIPEIEHVYREEHDSKRRRIERRLSGIQNVDVLSLILSDMPVKSIFSLMPTCKWWYNILTSDHLRKMHRDKHTSSPPLLIGFEYKFGDAKKHTLNITDLYGGILKQEIVSEHDFCRMGYPLKVMIMPSDSKVICFHSTHPNKYTLYNTTSSMFYPLPSFSSSPWSRNPNIRGSSLGYNPSLDVYYLVQLFEYNQSGVWSLEYLEMSFLHRKGGQIQYDNWIRIHDQNVKCISIGEGIFISGSFYWLISVDEGSQQLLCFQLTSHCFQYVELPQRLENLNNASLIELKGEVLYLHEINRDENSIGIWTLSTNKIWNKYKKVFLDNICCGANYNQALAQVHLLIQRIEYLDLYNLPYEITRDPDGIYLKKKNKDQLHGQLVIRNMNYYRLHTKFFTL